MEISKEQFIKVIDRLQKHMQKVDEIEKILGVVFDFYLLDDTVVELLELLMDVEVDETYSSTLSWWIYELNFGKKWKSDSLIVDGKSIDLSTAEKLYDFLTGY